MHNDFVLSISLEILFYTRRMSQSRESSINESENLIQGQSNTYQNATSKSPIPLTCPLITYEISVIILFPVFAVSFFCYFYYLYEPNDKSTTNFIIIIIYIFDGVRNSIQSWFHLISNSGVRLCQNNKKSCFYKTGKIVTLYCIYPQGFQSSTIIICNISIFLTIIENIILPYLIYKNYSNTNKISIIIIMHFIIVIYLIYILLFRYFRGINYFNPLLIIQNQNKKRNYNVNRTQVI